MVTVVLCLMTWLILEKLKQLQKISSRFTTSQKDRQHHRTTIMILVCSLLIQANGCLLDFHFFSASFKFLNSFFYKKKSLKKRKIIVFRKQIYRNTNGIMGKSWELTVVIQSTIGISRWKNILCFDVIGIK